MGNEKDDQKKQEKWTLEDGLKFLKELREMPYDTSKVGQVFVKTSRGQKPEIHETEGEKQ